MHILNVNPSIDLNSGGGGAERTFQMSRFLSRAGLKCTILTLDAGIDGARASVLFPVKVVTIKTLWKRFQVPYINWKQCKIISKLVRDADLVHLMSHWSVLNAIVYIAICFFKKPYVVCPAGTLPIFGRSSWLKRLYNITIGNSIIQNASGWIAVTRNEFSHFESYGVDISKIVVIPNGVSKEDFPETDIKSFIKHKDLFGLPIILFMGRLNLIKGPDLLLQAFALVQSQIPEYHLVLAGPDEGMLMELKNFTLKEHLSDRVHFLGYVNGIEKSAVYHSAKLLVVPSRQEAMSIVALEAGICGVPALLTDQCGFSEVRLINPNLEVAATVKGISEGLTRLLGENGVLGSVASAWKDFVAQNYSWDSISLHFVKLYQEILSNSKLTTGETE